MVVGVKILIIIALMGGLIAYMGDKLGTKVGKRRMSLFGLRPKHTSIIVTIVTGLLVAAATVGVFILYISKCANCIVWYGPITSGYETS